MKISPQEPYCIRQPIRRGHFNVSPQYPVQQVIIFFFSIYLSFITTWKFESFALYV